MTKKVSNNFVADIKRDHTITDRVTNNQLQYEIEKIVNNLKWSRNNKQEKIEEIDQIFFDFTAGKYEDREGAQTEPDWVQLENKREWQKSQQEVVDTLIEYFQQAQSQLFPDVKAKAAEDARARFEKRLAS